MRVGTITFHRVNNYGAVLQAYALQQTIINLGHESEIIDYSRENIKDVMTWQKNKIYNIVKGKPDKQPYSNKEFIKMVLTERAFNNKVVTEKFKEFRKNFKLSKHVTKKDVGLLNARYDLFISGSDQVWNCGRVNMDASYFLDFVKDNNKKASYAASFGISEIPEKYDARYKKLLSEYKYLGVREHVGAELVKQLINKEAKVVLDPTFLLNKEQWSKLLPANNVKEKVIIVYQLGCSPQLLEFANLLSKKTGLKLIMLNKVIDKNIKEEYRHDVGPIEWLEAIYNAEYIVTNSFHGIAFSINFNKKFFAEVTKERIRGAMGSRIENVLNIFELRDRLIENVDESAILDAIDYTRVNAKLEELKKDSIHYLESMLEA